MMPRYSVRNSLAWMGATQGLQFILQFGGSVVIARLLSPFDMGVFAVAMSLVSLLAIVRASGLPSYFVRAAELPAAMRASLFTVNAIIAVLLSMSIAGLGVFGGSVLLEPRVQQLLLVMAISPILTIFEFLPMAGSEREGRFKQIAMLSLARTAVNTAVTTAYAYAGYSYMSLAYGQVASAVVSLIGYNLIGWRYAAIRLGLEHWRDILRYGLQMLAIGGVGTVSARLSEIALARILGLAELGFYSRASALYGLLWDNVHITVARILFVDFARQKREGLSLRVGYLRVLEMTTGLLWPAFFGMAVIAGPLVRLLYGPAWVSAAIPLSLLSLAAVPLVAISMTYEVFVICGETARQTRLEFIRAGVGLVLFIAGCLVSLTGAAASRIAEAAVCLRLYRAHLERLTDTQWPDYVPIYRRGALLSLAAAGPAAVVMALNGWSPVTPLAEVAGGIVLGMAGWGLSLRMLCPPLHNEARLIVGRIWSQVSPVPKPVR